jgi:sarcosine oxidase
MSPAARIPLIVDVAVVGGGAIGAATAWLLARRGSSVALLEEGSARSVRDAARGTAWSAHPCWDVDDASRVEAVGLWRALEAETGAALLRRTDVVDHGRCRPGRATVLSPADAAARWAGASFTGPVHLRRAVGAQVHADQAIAALTAAAAGHGAVLRHRVGQATVQTDGDRVEIRTGSGRVSARRAVVVTTEPAGPVELHFPARSGRPVAVPPIAHHHDELGLVRVATCAAGHLAVSAAVPDADRLRAYVRTWFPGIDADRPEPVAAGAWSTAGSPVTVDRAGTIVHIRSAGTGSVATPAQGRMIADVLTGATAGGGEVRSRVS